MKNSNLISRKTGEQIGVKTVTRAVFDENGRPLSDLLTNQNEAINTNKSNINVLTSRMDTFTSLEEGSTTGDAELQDIRVGYDGTTYPTAGNAVREQISELNGDLAHLTHFESSLYKSETANLIDFTKYEKGKYINYRTGKTVDDTGLLFHPIIVEPNETYVFLVCNTSYAGNTFQKESFWICYYDSNFTFISGERAHDNANKIMTTPSTAMYAIGYYINENLTIETSRPIFGKLSDLSGIIGKRQTFYIPFVPAVDLTNKLDYAGGKHAIPIDSKTSARETDSKFDEMGLGISIRNKCYRYDDFRKDMMEENDYNPSNQNIQNGGFRFITPSFSIIWQRNRLAKVLKSSETKKFRLFVKICVNSADIISDEYGFNFSLNNMESTVPTFRVNVHKDKLSLWRNNDTRWKIYGKMSMGEPFIVYGDFTYNGSENPYIRWFGAYTANARSIDISIEDFYISELSDIHENTTIENMSSRNYPYFYKDHMESKISEIKSHEVNTSVKGDSFVFITDLHLTEASGYEYNSGNSPAMINEIMARTNCRFVATGGDIGQLSEGTDAMKDVLHGFLDKFDKNIKVYNCTGNHEYFSQGYSGTGNQITKEEVYGTTVKRNEFDYVSVGDMNSFCFDNAVQKIRYFVIGCGKSTESSDECKKWFASELEKVPDDWYIVPIYHALLTDDVKGFRGSHAEFVTIMDEYKARNVYTFADIQHNYTNCKAKIIFILTGHTHIDGTIYTPKGIRVICTTCDSYKQNYEYVDGIPTLSSRTKNTVDDQAFDVVQISLSENRVYLTRIGYGNSRSYTF